MKRMQKLLAVLLAALILSLTVPFAFGAEVASGKCGVNLNWTLSSTGHLTVTGTGKMTDACVWMDYADQIKSVTLPSGLTTIGAGSFEQCRNLTSISIPEKVTSIGIQAFSYCKALKSVTMPKKLTSLGNKAFQYCESLETITISNGIKSIDAYTFMGCKNLMAVLIPTSVETIGFNAFKTCYLMKTLYYAGSERQWANVTREEGNECFDADDLVIKYNALMIDGNYQRPESDSGLSGLFSRLISFFRDLFSRLLSFFTRASQTTD